MTHSTVYFQLYKTQVSGFTVRYKKDLSYIFLVILEKNLMGLWSVLRPITSSSTAKWWN
jgi:hypothetical protein